MFVIHRDFFYHATNQYIIKFSDLCRLGGDKVMELRDAIYLFITLYAFDFRLLFQFPEVKDFIGAYVNIKL